MSRFEGSFLGAEDKISAQAVMECKICWTPYDPAEGDDYRQVEPGTPFLALPDDWSCPNCGAPKEQFMVLEDPGAEPVADAARLDALTARLVAEFREIWHAKMRDVPMVNKLLSVEAVGFRMVDGRPLGVLVSPWFMNLVQLPGEGEDWSGLTPGTKELIAFPSGDYEFIHNTRDMIGGYKACSLFSPMGDFSTQLQAQEVARAIMVALFDEGHRAETDRAADIRAEREAALAPEENDAPSLTDAPTRRAVISGGLAET
ncbi:[NiFe]-hydrogenase assembly chaperone HybE [Roseovarius atlanticus]|uniref:[NiFe]-hydrogenase assembly chaperone HybE n=1 Tax=Roseovarius atlanticus TaxID=1641875 RepID=UPI001C98012A|nr:[NiFe]-hydrogenase assembly chaperone HybE [Roseovarius atlanticus]MBY5988974.1 [NiFe]-hydrogenase assembly chaperone HybE [Roseovarius atlanticus]MBY6124366.1 [NiFe]-hydrogenase assembly chaperone HybE [Roseovarius atlanticus]MBY6148861.1 [NiFe]-hydrogenase assembly chaperone HybE [Roseovarius atlanticus]